MDKTARTRILRFRNARGEVVEVEPVAATQLKNELGSVIDRAVRGQAVAITRHDTPRAVIVSYEDFQALAQARQPSLEGLTAEFDRVLEAMQSPRARQGAQDAFDADPQALGRAAVKAAQGKAAKRVAARSVTARKARKA